MLFREGTDFTVLERSRGEWSEPADDVTPMTIDYVFYSLQKYGELAGVFERLFRLFWENYLRKTGDREILEVFSLFMLGVVWLLLRLFGILASTGMSV